MRLAAGLLILLISGGWGLRRRGLLKRRCTLLSELRLLLEQYSIEIACTAPTLDHLAAEGRGEFGAILRECSGNTPDIRRAWSEAVERISALPYCQAEEAEILSALGKELGTCPAESVLSLLRLYSARLDRLYEQAEKISDQKGRLYSSGGILAGLAAAVLLL